MTETESSRAQAAGHDGVVEPIVRGRDFYHQLFESLPAMIWRSDVDAKCDYFNQAWLTFRGRRMAEELGDGWLAGVHASDVERCMATYLTAFRAREPFEMEYRLCRHDGQYRWVVDIGRPFLDVEGNFAGYIGLCHDETERKRSEQALRGSEAQFRVMAETVPEIVFTSTADGSCDFLNQRFSECTGFPPGSGLGFGWVEALHPDDAQRAQTRWMEAVDRSSAYEDHYRLTLRDGTYHWFITRAHPVRDGDGKIIKWFGVSTEIEDLVQAKQAIQASEERLRLALDATTEGVWDWNIGTGHVFFSPRWFESLGYAPGELKAHVESWERLVHPEDMPRVRDALAAHFDGHTPVYECVNRLLTKWGHYRWNLDRGMVVARDHDGKPLRMVGTDVDITERKRAEEELRRSQAKLSTITDAIPGAVYQYMLTPGGEQRFLYISRGIEPLLELRPEELLADFNRAWRLAHPDDVQGLWASIEHSARTLQPWVHEFRVMVNGRVKWLRGSSIPEGVRADGCIVWNGILVDHTERRGTEDALRFAQFSTDRAADAIYWMSQDARFFYVNDEACRVLGYCREELLGMTVHDIDPDYPAEAWPAVWTHLQEQGSFVVEARHRAKDGRVFPVEIRLNLLEFEGKQFNCSVVRDISERKRVERALADRARQQASVSALGQFALSGMDLATLLEKATQCVAQVLDVELSKVLALESGNDTFLLLAGSGWDEGCVGHVTVPTQTGSQAGYTLHVNEPVIVEDFRTEARFSIPALLQSHGVVSGISVPIRCNEGFYGVLGAHARSPRAFLPEDAHFLLNVANVLGNAISRKRAEDVLKDQTAQLQAITDSMSSYLETGDWRNASARIVRAALDLTRSAYGFVGAVVDGTELRILAQEGTSWDRSENTALYDEAVRTNEQRGYLEVRTLDNLFARVITLGQAVLSNEPSKDQRPGEVPAGHPPLRHVLGVPIRRGTEVVGMIGLANKPGGYGPPDETKVMVLANAAGVLYENYRQRQREAALDAARRQAEEDLRAAQQRLLDRQRLEKEQVEAELDKARETLVRQTRLAALGQLSGSVAHEIRNPLGSIRNALFLLKRRLPPDDDKSGRYLNMAEEEVDAANRTIQDLLALSGGKEAVKEEIDLSVLLEEAFHRAKIPDTVMWTSRLETSPFIVRADPVQLRQVFVNLIQNAVQAMDARGHIDIRAHKLPEGDVILIRDSGPGIPDTISTRLFEPLFTTKAKGTGLGLTICRQIVERHNGTIEFVAPRAGGASFRIQLPQVRPER